LAHRIEAAAAANVPHSDSSGAAEGSSHLRPARW